MLLDRVRASVRGVVSDIDAEQWVNRIMIRILPLSMMGERITVAIRIR